jgi:hypothetical protein
MNESKIVSLQGDRWHPRKFLRLGCTCILAVAALSIPSAAQTSVLTWHNDNGRTGQTLTETVLTPTNVTSSTFGKVLSYPVDGQIYTQPLYVPNVSIPGKGTHNVVYVGTEDDSVYAFDADGLSSAPLWRTSFAIPSAGINPVNCVSAQLSCNVYPMDGVTGTPVIDLSSNTMYVASHTSENGSYYMRLHALDITSGAEKFGGPVNMTATVPGTGVGSSQGQLSLNVKNDLVRPGLLLSNGVLYVAQGGYPHGWILTYDPQTLTQIAAFATTPNGTLGGIWQTGAGMAADSAGNVYASTGDGTFDASTGGTDYGDTLLKLNSTLNVLDYFAPMDQACRFVNDMDLASAGPMALPTQPGAYPNEIIMAGKGGYPCDPGNFGLIYLVNADSMGQYDPSLDHIPQTITGSASGYRSNPAYWQGPNSTLIYFAGVVSEHAQGDYLKAYSLTNGLLSTSPVSQSSNVFVTGGTPSISANGNQNGIVWVLERQDYLDKRPGILPAVLYAYDATDLSKMLYNSNNSSEFDTRDQPGCGTKFQVPTVANGKVFVGTESELDIYGLLNQPLAPYPVFVSSPCLSFGSVFVGSTSTAQTVTIQNNGTTNLSFKGMTLRGLNSYDYSQTNTCMKVTLAPGASCTLSVTFTPTSPGPSIAGIEINDTAITQQTVSLIGNGTAALTLTPASLNFGPTKVGTKSQPKTATFSNVGTTNVTISSIVLIQSGDFAQTNNCPSTLGPGLSCTINVTFTPLAIGNRHGRLNVNNSAGPALQTVLLGIGN